MMPHSCKNCSMASSTIICFHGHTHLRRDERIGRTRAINPTLCNGLQRAEKSVALLDFWLSDQLRFLIVCDAVIYGLQ